MIARLRGRGGRGAAGRSGAEPATPVAPPARAGQATTIDALFGPLPNVESRGRVWLYVDNQLRPVPVRLGISDGQATELLEGELTDGTEVVTNVSTGAEARPTPGGPGGFPPFMGGGRGDFGRGGNRGGGNNRGGGR